MKKSLATRSNIYYAISGLQLLGMAVSCVLIIGAEYFLMSYGDQEMFEHQMNSLIVIGMFILAIFNGIYSLYAANWTDSVVLSMGARRKDIFRGQIIKTAVVMILGTGIVVTVICLADRMDYLRLVLGIAIAAFPISALLYVIGHKIKKFGKLGLIVTIIVATIIGALIGCSLSGLANSLATFNANLTAVVFAGGAVVLYLLIELWAYKLNKNSMVH